jgi:uncharacterized protein YjbJ (UPF0337 family)
MNADIFEGRWRQMRGDLRSWWGKLTNDDLEKIAGKRDRLVGMLQEKYGYTRQVAEQEVDRRFGEYGGRMGGTSPRAVEEPVSSQSTATMNASQPISAVGEKIGSLAGAIRSKAPHEGTVGTAASTVAEKLDAAGSYLQTRDFDQMASDLSDMIRRYPIPSLLVGLGIGYLLAKSTRR